jgi:hypothetical protein
MSLYIESGKLSTRKCTGCKSYRSLTPYILLDNAKCSSYKPVSAYRYAGKVAEKQYVYNRFVAL